MYGLGPLSGSAWSSLPATASFSSPVSDSAGWLSARVPVFASKCLNVAVIVAAAQGSLYSTSPKPAFVASPPPVFRAAAPPQALFGPARVLVAPALQPVFVSSPLPRRPGPPGFNPAAYGVTGDAGSPSIVNSGWVASSLIPQTGPKGWLVPFQPQNWFYDTSVTTTQDGMGWYLPPKVSFPTPAFTAALMLGGSQSLVFIANPPPPLYPPGSITLPSSLGSLITTALSTPSSITTSSTYLQITTTADVPSNVTTNGTVLAATKIII